MGFPDDDEIARTRSSIVSLLNQEFDKHNSRDFDAYKFGAAVAPLVNAIAALSLMEMRRRHNPEPGEASRSDD